MHHQPLLGRAPTEMKITDTALRGVGVGLRALHYREMLATRPNLAFLEVHSENFFEFECSEMPEWEFLAAVAKRTGCGILLDINNIYVSASNHGYNPTDYLDAIPAAMVKEMHLAGHERSDRLLIDTHGAPIAAAVWDLYADAVRRFGDVPTLIERDTNIPPLVALIGEANRAEHVLRENGYGLANASA